MAKNNANARSKRVANKKKAANRQKNEARNQSRSFKGFPFIKSSGSNEGNATDSRYEDLFVDLANEWRTSNKPYVASEFLLATHQACCIPCITLRLPLDVKQMWCKSFTGLLLAFTSRSGTLTGASPDITRETA